ncbi:macrophage migration inhibitory factor-like [Anticarsia gemmatalis]|uniref:macrophage migration inhibitory factor-like n=1 Tax=Anticarsia gemmatalis TaxID=129554 RepID=UPI003F762D93
MPCFKFFTNLSRDKIPENFVRKIVPLLARTVRKPEDKFVVVVSPDCTVYFASDPPRPSAVASLESIGHLGQEENKLITKEVSEFIHKELGISADDFFLSFYDLHGQNIGKGGIIHG